jgi:hypothetical protein
LLRETDGGANEQDGGEEGDKKARHGEVSWDREAVHQRTIEL